MIHRLVMSNTEAIKKILTGSAIPTSLKACLLIETRICQVEEVTYLVHTTEQIGAKKLWIRKLTTPPKKNILEKLTIKKLSWGHESQLILSQSQDELCVCLCLLCPQSDYIPREDWNCIRDVLYISLLTHHIYGYIVGYIIIFPST